MWPTLTTPQRTSAAAQAHFLRLSRPLRGVAKRFPVWRENQTSKRSLHFAAEMAYQRGPVYSTDSSASLLPGNLSVYKGDTQDEVNFAVIHKHLAIVGQLGSSDSFTQLCHGKLVDKDPTSYLTQVIIEVLIYSKLYLILLLQVKWCKLESSLEIIVLTSYKGIKVKSVSPPHKLVGTMFLDVDIQRQWQ